MRKSAPVLALVMALAAIPFAHATDQADLMFWQSVSNSHDPGEYRAYLQAYPNGQFAALAKIRLEYFAQQRGAAPSSAPAAASLPQASIEPTHPVYRAIDRIDFDADASNLDSGSNFRMIVVPANTPDGVGDPSRFQQISTTVTAQYLHMSLPPGPVGNDQIRLLYVPQYGNHFVVAARAAIRVLPGTPGAMTTSQLVLDAKLSGQVPFEAKYRNRIIKLEGQFLRVETRTTWGGWDAAGRYHDPARYVEMYLGALGTPDAESGAPTEVQCLMVIDNAALARIAAFQPGSDVVVTGTPTTWDSYFGTAALTFDRCQFAQ
jgi:hypothetical protein